MLEPDHAFILCDWQAPQAAALRALGLAEGAPNVHPGQGTRNRRFLFAGFMLELLWVHRPDEAQNARTRRTCLWPRWQQRGAGASPFGVALRGAAPAARLPGWAYRPLFLPSSLSLQVGDNAGRLQEPFVFCMPPVALPPVPGPRNAGTLASLVLHTPLGGACSPTLRALAAVPGVRVQRAREHLLALALTGAGIAEADLRPQLPLVISAV